MDTTRFVILLACKFFSFVIFISFKLKHSKTNQAVISSGLPDFHFRRNSSGVWMRELWQTTPHLWSLDSFSALNSQFWHHHHPQPWSTAKVLSRSVSHTCEFADFYWPFFSICHLFVLAVFGWLFSREPSSRHIYTVKSFTEVVFGCLLAISSNLNGIQTFKLNKYGCLCCFLCLFHYYFI